ncbi:MAG: helix-turn-helix transcriptional regulator [Phaeodactylibacter sp.]|nr:helix-turn-helix transcriptional regulator [Phaeodactylibacter sp.]MCB9277205.1 helix-turn-helix transcriptional regulator [Lewinellaceae bacterium]
MDVQFQEAKPQEILQPYVSGYWRAAFHTGTSASPLSLKVVPRGEVELVLHLSGQHCDLVVNDGWQHSPDFTLIGMWTTAYEVRFRSRVEALGIRFTPDGFFSLFGIAPSEFSQRQADMEDVLGKAFRDYCTRLQDMRSFSEQTRLTGQFLLSMLRQNNRAPRYLNPAARLIRQTSGGISIDELSRQVFISPRQLEREFRNIIGLSPKAYIRINRMRQAQQLIGQPDFDNLAQLSYHCGYYDQSHFIRDFKQMAGMAPGSFLARRGEFI